MVISAMRRDFSAVRITLLLKVSPRNLEILLRPASTSLRMAGVISNCLPVYSTFIDSLLVLGGTYVGQTPANEIITTEDHNWNSGNSKLQVMSVTGKAAQRFPIPTRLDARVGRPLYQLNGKTAKGKRRGWSLVTGNAWIVGYMLSPATNNQSRATETLALDSSLLCGRDLHVFAVLGHGTPRDLDPLRLQDARDLFIGKRMFRVFVFDQLFHTPLEDE